MHALQLLFHCIIIFLFQECTCQQNNAHEVSTLDNDPNGTSQLSFQILVQYFSSSNQLEITTVYANGSLNQAFSPSQFSCDCSNTNNFLLNQTSETGTHQWVIQNYNQTLWVQLYNPYSTPKTCNTSVNVCVIQIANNCSSRYSNQMVRGKVSNSSSFSQAIQLQYYIVCNQSLRKNQFIIPWGVLILVLFSILMIALSAKFQHTSSNSHIIFYINYPLVALYCIIVIVKYVLILKQVPKIDQAMLQFCFWGSLLFGVLGSMLCFSQFAYATKTQIFRRGFQKGRIRFRVMDAIGIMIGIGLLSSWYFSHKSWIISNLIFVLIYISVIKFIKLGSLKMATLIYICILAINIGFYHTMQSINNVYTNSNFDFFNNPLFLMVPMLAKVPNHTCQWYFITSMGYPGMFLAFLQRFDKNRSSHVYGFTFNVCYGLFSVVWLIVSIFSKIPLPYDLFTVPIAVSLLLLFANRRGELKQLWNGKFHDEPKTQFQTQQEMKERYKQQSLVPLPKFMFSNLRYGQNSSDVSSKKSNLLQFINNNDFKVDIMRSSQDKQRQVKEDGRNKKNKSNIQMTSLYFQNKGKDQSNINNKQRNI